MVPLPAGEELREEEVLLWEQRRQQQQRQQPQEHRGGRRLVMRPQQLKAWQGPFRLAMTHSPPLA